MTDIPHAERYLGRRVINWLIIALLALLAIILILVLCGRVLFIGPWTVGINYPSRDVPVGTVLPFWGSTANIPKGFELCDGRQVSTEGSLLLGADKPDLRDRFLKGALAGVDDVTKNPEIGAEHVKDISHHHGAGSTLRALIGPSGVKPDGGDYMSFVTRGGPIDTRNAPTLANQFTMAFPQGSGGPTLSGVAVEGDTADAVLHVDVRPKFLSLLFIIKVR